MKFSDYGRWVLGLIIVIAVAIAIAVVTNLNTTRQIKVTNAKLDEINTNLGNKIDSSTEKTVAAINESNKVTVAAINESNKVTVAAINDSSRAIVEAIQLALGSPRPASDSPSESPNIVENTSEDNLFPIVADKNQEVYLNLTGAIEEIGLVPNSEALSPVVLVSLNNKHSEEDLTKILALSSVPIVKESFVTFDKNSKEYPLFWSILSPAVVPSHLEGAPLTLSYAIIN